jgi:Holliday junction DNA helicase RuvA
MYNHIRGKMTHKSPSKVVVEAAGVGYDITVPLSAGSRLPAVGSEATVLVHMVVREDEMRLIGFADAEERELFSRLIGLSGVGPSMALQILSGMTPREFALAVESQDAAALRRVKGVGEKTAKRIILELKGAKTILTPSTDDMPEGAASEAVSALMALGVPQNEAIHRVENAMRRDPGAGIEDIIRAALQ